MTSAHDKALQWFVQSGIEPTDDSLESLSALIAEERPERPQSAFPIQPIINDEQGRPRFVTNRIVETLLDSGELDMNALAVMDFTDEEREQFSQLIGYSLGGFGELSYVSDQAYTAAVLMSQGMTSDEAQIAFLQDKLAIVKKSLKGLVPALFDIHPDDLEG